MVDLTEEKPQRRYVIKQFKGPTRWLSNFWKASVSYEGITFPSTEHAYQAAKTLDMDLRKKVAMFEKCGEAKRWGKIVELRSDWEEVKVRVMLSVNLEKFSKHPKLRERLLLTGPLLLIEGNTWGDHFWGVDLLTLEGENKLGQVLMHIREELQQAP